MLGKKRRRLQDSMLQATTIIGEGSRVVGQLFGDGVFVICGLIESDSELSGPVTIANTGRWVGQLRGRDILIAGTVEGDVIASGKLELLPTAHVIGSIIGGRIAIAQGARVEGGMTVTQEKEPTHFVERRS